jgi:tetratricopeptide (TPR) repeat protein
MKRMLDIAQALHSQGRLSEAETQYRRVLQGEPHAVEALRGLGALAYQHGRVDEAVVLFARGVSIHPEAADFRANLAEALRILNRSDEAIEHVRQAIAIDPNLADAWNTMGLLAHAQRRFPDAVSAYGEAILLRPKFVPAHINQGSTLQAMGRLDDAAVSLRRALELEPDNAAALTNLGQVLIDMKDLDLLDQAEDLCRRALALAPGLWQAINSLGNVLRLKGQIDDALSYYLQSLQINPRQATPCHNIGKLHQECGRFQEAAHWFERAQSMQDNPARYHANHGSLWADQRRFDESARSYRRALAYDPKSTEAHQGLGDALLEEGQFDLAETYFREALRIDSSLPRPWISLARLLAERGDLSLSCQAARKAAALCPKLADAYVALANNLRSQLPADDVDLMEEILKQNYLSDEAASLLLFGLGSVYDARGDYARAAARLQSANSLQTAARAARGQVDDPARHEQFVDRIIKTFTRELIAHRRGWGDPDPRPVFVVGLPRSGSTLIEQILASHPHVHGAGELPHLRNVFHSLPEIAQMPWADSFDVVNTLDRSIATRAARQYIEHLDRLAPARAGRVVDKMPDNIEMLGLIALLWPNARVIVCQRDLRDVAISCWQTPFASILWASDHEHLAARFASYQRILHYWKISKPLEWLDLSYEDLIRDLDGQSRRLIDFVGLEWDPACLQFHTNNRVVRTASKLQVRQPLHSHSVGRWKRYEHLIQPLFEAMERHGVIH